MRYHWGLGVGHLHAHQPSGTCDRISEEPDAQDIQLLYETEERLGENNMDTQIQEGDSDVDNHHDPELDLEDHEYEGWDEEDLEDENRVELEGIEGEEFTGL
jgi:hypothetical protein